MVSAESTRAYKGYGLDLISGYSDIHEKELLSWIESGKGLAYSAASYAVRSEHLEACVFALQSRHRKRPIEHFFLDFAPVRCRY